MIKRKILGVEIEITNNNVRIIDSFKITDKNSMKNILNIVRNLAMRKGIYFKRNNKSWIQEWKAHNLLYKFHLLKSHTKDTDLEENESKFRLFCYKILGY